MIVIFSTFITGYGIGVNNQIKSVKGVYNIDIYNSSGKVVITTKLKYLDGSNSDEARLVINGHATHDEIN